jgi:FkbM family methyltransferase
MKLLDGCKAVWKAAMRLSLRAYTGNWSLYIYNNRKDLDDIDVEKLYGQNTHVPPPIGRAFYGQYGQDAYVLRTIYKNKESGTFVDVGANHPVECSNSYLLELNGWSGLAVEPQTSLNRLWPETRRTPCLDCAVGDESKDVVFIQASPEEHGHSGVEGFNKVKRDASKHVVCQKTLDEILRDHGISEIDYLSIDVEGYEMSVLRGIDFSKSKIRLIGIENDTGFKSLPFLGKRLGFELGNNEIRRFLSRQGYEHIARIVSDDFFIRAD